MSVKPGFNNKSRPGEKGKFASKKKLNPFELHINRTKLAVLGQKNKNDRGMPGVARARANKIREKTLLDEYKKRHKNNVFKDRRIGENNPTMDPEKKIALRMAKEMRRQLSKKTLYNLNDDDDGNEGLAEEKLTFNDEYNFSDDDEDPEDQQLDYKYVKAQHFGSGGLLTRSVEDGDKGEDSKKQFKSKKERIEEIIAESKMAKANKKRDKEQVEDAVKENNSQFDVFMSLMKKNLTAKDKEKAEREDEFKDYMKLTRELLIDRSNKAKATNKLKTPEEIAKEEIERLRSLEAARVSRMMGEEPNTKANKSAWSADDLNDGFVLNDDDKQALSYSQGRLNVNLVADQEGENDDDGDLDEAEDDNSEKTDDAESADDDEADDEDEDNYSDILDDDDSDNEVEEALSNIKITKKDTVKEEEQKSTMMESAKNEIPFTFEVPQQYEGFYALFEDKSPEDMSTILHRMISCNHPTLGNNNTAKCQEIFKYILQTVQLLSDGEGQSFKEGILPLQYLDSLIQHLYALTQLSPNSAADSLVNVIEEKYSEYSAKKIKKYPLADCFIFLKISGMLFPSSDYQHVVMTPVISFLTQLMGQCKLLSARDFSAALFTANLVYEYVYTSKRYIPELWNLLQQFIFLSIPGNDKTKLPYTGAPFKRVGPQSLLLVVNAVTDGIRSTKLTLRSLNEELEFTDELRSKIFHESLILLNKLCQLWKDLPAFHAVISPLLILLNLIPLQSYPQYVLSSLEELKSTIINTPSTLEYLTKKASKPKALKMYEPTIRKIFDGGKTHNGDKQFQEMQKLTYKYKQGRKNAQKALRTDAAFLAKHKHKEIIERDSERKRKVNKLLSELAYQESDYKKIKRKKF